MPSTLTLYPTTVSHWHALVSEAEYHLSCRLDEDVESYLVFMLMRHTAKPDWVNKIIAVDFLEGLSLNGRVQHERLRNVGDQCLLISGLFPDRAKRRRVQLSYFIDLGQSAYQLISSEAYELTDVFQKMSQAFLPAREVLAAMRLTATR